MKKTKLAGLGNGRNRGRLSAPSAAAPVPPLPTPALKPLRRSEPSALRGKPACKVQTGAEECFQIHQNPIDALPAFAMTIKMTDKFKEMVQNAKKKGLSARMKFGSTPAGHVIEIGGTEFNFASNTEAAGLCDLFGTNKRKSESISPNVLNLEGNVTRKLSVKRPLDHIEAAKWKKITQEVDKSQKIRHVQIVDIKAGGPGNPPIKKLKPMPTSIRTIDSKPTGRHSDPKPKFSKPPTALLDFSSPGTRFSRSKETSLSHNQNKNQMKDGKAIQQKDIPSEKDKGMDLKSAVMAAKNVKELREFLIQLLSQQKSGMKLKEIEASAKKEWNSEMIQKTLTQIAVDSKEGYKLLPHAALDVNKMEVNDKRDVEESTPSPLDLTLPPDNDFSIVSEENRIEQNAIDILNLPTSSTPSSLTNPQKSANPTHSKDTSAINAGKIERQSAIAAERVEVVFTDVGPDERALEHKDRQANEKDESGSSDGESSKDSESGEESDSDSENDNASDSDNENNNDNGAEIDIENDNGSESDSSESESDNESNSSEEIDIVDSDAEDAEVAKNYLNEKEKEVSVHVEVDEDDCDQVAANVEQLDNDQNVHVDTSMKPDEDIDLNIDHGRHSPMGGRAVASTDKKDMNRDANNELNENANDDLEVDIDEDMRVDEDMDLSTGNGNEKKEIENEKEDEVDISIDSPEENDVLSQIRKNANHDAKAMEDFEGGKMKENDGEGVEEIETIDALEEGEARDTWLKNENSHGNRSEINRSLPTSTLKPASEVSIERNKENSGHNPPRSHESQNSKLSSKDKIENEKTNSCTLSSWNDEIKSDERLLKKEKPMIDCTGKNYGEGDGEDGSHERRSGGGGGSDDGVESIGSRTNGLNEEKNTLNETPPTPVGMTLSKATSWGDEVEPVKVDKSKDGFSDRDVRMSDGEENFTENKDDFSMKNQSQTRVQKEPSNVEASGRMEDGFTSEMKDRVKSEKNVIEMESEKKNNALSTRKEGKKPSKEDKKDLSHRVNSSQTAPSALDTEKDTKDELKEKSRNESRVSAGAERMVHRKRKLDEKDAATNNHSKGQKPSTTVDEYSNKKKMKKLNEKCMLLSNGKIISSSPSLPPGMEKNVNEVVDNTANSTLAMDVDPCNDDAEMQEIETELRKFDEDELKYFEDDVDTFTYFEKYEKGDAALCNRITSDHEYKQKMDEHIEKYDVYERINADLRRIFVHYNLIYQDAKRIKSERGQYILIKNVFSQYAHSYERLKRMKSTYDILEKELQSIKFRLKEYINSNRW